MQAFRALHMQVLENSHLQVRRGDAALTIAGVTDPVAARYGLPLPDLETALAGADPAAPVILLDHRPRKRRTGLLSRISCSAGIPTAGRSLVWTSW